MNKIFGSRIYRKEFVENSMLWAQEEAQNAPDGALFIANQLGGAQGRQGRSWGLRAGQLCVTAVLKPNYLSVQEDHALRLNQLGIALATGIAKPLTQFGIGIKWPNDFFGNNKKIGGMLLRPLWQGEKLLAIIFGFALNVQTIFSQDDELFTIATSITQLTEKKIETRALFYELLMSLDQAYALWKEEAFKTIYISWRKQLLYLGQEVKLHRHSGEIIIAKILQVMPNGDALIENETKKQELLPFHLVEKIVINQEI